MLIFQLATHLYRVFHLKQIEEGPDEGDDEGGDDDEEEEVIVTKTEVVAASVDCLRRSGACHADDAENLGENVEMQCTLHDNGEKRDERELPWTIDFSLQYSLP